MSVRCSIYNMTLVGCNKSKKRGGKRNGPCHASSPDNYQDIHCLSKQATVDDRLHVCPKSMDNILINNQLSIREGNPVFYIGVYVPCNCYCAQAVTWVTVA